MLLSQGDPCMYWKGRDNQMPSFSYFIDNNRVIIKIRVGKMQVAFAMGGGCPWGTAMAVPGLSAKGEFRQGKT